jgi:hypothetical protein
MNQGREIRNQGLNIVATGNQGLRGWDRTNLSTAVLLWVQSGVIKGLASKSKTTWFVAGSDALA